MRFNFCEQGFQQCLSEVDNLIALSTVSASDKDTILRSALLLAVSAFDFLIHELTRVECVDRVAKGKTINMEIPISNFTLQTDDLKGQVDLILRRKHSHKAFVSSSNIKDAFSFFCTDFWTNYAKSSLKDKSEITKSLDDIWKWRNRIAHEGDFIPSGMTFVHWPIYREDVEAAVTLLRDLGRDITTTIRGLH